MIGYTRDIVDGKGEYTLTYMMILTWYDVYPELALFAIKCLVDLRDNKSTSVHQYGSWKDIKYFCKYCKSQQISIDSPLIKYCITLINEQLLKDYNNIITDPNNISLAAKWVPREKSSFGWLYEKLATNYFVQYMRTSTKLTVDKAILKCKTDYRKVCSILNKHIDTLQIKQCQQSWSKINFDNVTAISMNKQYKAFMNIKNKDIVDRKICANNFTEYLKSDSSRVKDNLVSFHKNTELNKSDLLQHFESQLNMWTLLETNLSNKRYLILEEKIEEII